MNAGHLVEALVLGLLWIENTISIPTAVCLFYDLQCHTNITYKQIHLDICNKTQENCQDVAPVPTGLLSTPSGDFPSSLWHICYIEYRGEPARIYRGGCLPETEHCTEFCSNIRADTSSPFICCCQGDRCNAANFSSPMPPEFNATTTSASDVSFTTRRPTTPSTSEGMTTDPISIPTNVCSFYDLQCLTNITYKQIHLDICNKTQENCQDVAPVLH
jgi:hypothetical protein